MPCRFRLAGLRAFLRPSGSESPRKIRIFRQISKWFRDLFLVKVSEVSKRQARRRENRVFRASGGGVREKARILRFGECRMSRFGGNRFLFGGPPAGGGARAVRGCRSPARKGFRNVSPVLSARRVRIGVKGASEAPFFPASRPVRDFFAARNSRLCGKKEISFSKEIPFCAERSGAETGEMLV